MEEILKIFFRMTTPGYHRLRALKHRRNEEDSLNVIVEQILHTNKSSLLLCVQIVEYKFYHIVAQSSGYSFKVKHCKSNYSTNFLDFPINEMESSTHMFSLISTKKKNDAYYGTTQCTYIDKL